MKPHTLRTLLAASALAAAVGLSACGGAPAAAPPPAAPAAPDATAQQAAVQPAAATGVTEFVGPLGDGTLYVAFALAPGGAVEAYVCDGTGRAENFTGALAGDRISLTSADGDSTITATAAAAAVTGSIAFRGQELPFDVKKVQGVGGLYDFAVTDAAGGGVQFTGGSRGGNTATLTVNGTSASGGTITLVNGTTQPLTPLSGQAPAELNGFEAYRVLVADDGTRRGNPKPGAKRKDTSSGGGSFTCPLIF